MSRIGNKPVQIPAGVEVAVNGNNVVVKGPKGQLELDVFEKLAINVEDNVLTVSRPDDERETRARHGLTRALIHNMVVGVSEGFEKKLELAGVGYRVQQKGKNLEFSLGFSHPVIVEAPEGITFEVPDNTHVNVKGINKQQVGQIAAEIAAIVLPSLTRARVSTTLASTSAASWVRPPSSRNRLTRIRPAPRQVLARSTFLGVYV